MTASIWKYILCLIGFFLAMERTMGEGSKELNSNGSTSTYLNFCNDFANHCSNSSGQRSQFATYDGTQSAGDNDRLYFVTNSASEVLYMGFNSATFNPANPARHMVFRIKNLAGTVVFAEQTVPSSGTGYISSLTQAINGPNQLPSPAITNGYDAIVFTPPAPGTYFIEFSVRRDDNNNFYIGTFNLELFDLTVGNTATHTAKPGRLYSKAWQFNENNGFYGTNYFISDDSIVTSAQFTNMQGGRWIQYCNQTGCGNSSANWITNRKSLFEQQALFPQYKIFLNNPDPVLFPAASTLGQLVPPMPYGVQNCQTGHILFHVTVDKPGNAEITLTFPSPYLSRVLNQAVVTGDNLFDWDGLDGTLPAGVPVPNNVMVQFTVKYINGLTNLPLYDVEGNNNGFTIALVNPPGATPAVFWDDSNIPGGTTNLNPGCISPPGCHPWSSSSGGGGFGDLNTMNTWWYNVSTSTSPATIEQWRGPQALVFNQSPPQNFCANTSGHLFSVTPDVNTDVYHFSYTPSTGVTLIQATPATPSVTLNFASNAVSGVLTVYGSNTNCAANGPSSSLPVTIYPVPVPTVNGPATACAGQTNCVYTTEVGKSNYQWTVSSGGLITAGGGTTNSSVTVTWNTAGPQTVSVNYTNGSTQCTAPSPTVKQVTVNARPVPGISGSNLACIGTTGMIYSTESGKSNYTWQISSGGTITSGGTSGSSTATVSWNTLGAQWISVSYTDPVTGCTAAAPAIQYVTVNNLPVPTFQTGPASACVGVPNQFYSTEAGMTNYIWNISGGTITSGGTSTSNVAWVTWNLTGNQTISVNYTLPFSSCTSPTATQMTVAVKPLPTPSVISGSTSVCLGSTGNLYQTQSGKSGYAWSVTGGTITGGGGLTDDYAIITWTSTGVRSVSINYTDPVTNCTAATPSMYYVTVKPLPVPTMISGDPEACLNTPGHAYSTQPGMLAYTWFADGGTITAGGTAGDNQATVTWTSPGLHTITVGYTDPVTQCTSVIPASMSVLVKTLPVPTLTGVDTVCRLSSGNSYQTEPGMTGYAWTLSGGTVTAGGGNTNASAQVNWTQAGMQSISVYYTDPQTGCTAAVPVSLPVWVNELPVPEITGPDAACVNVAGPLYTAASGMTNYQWNISGGTITSGGAAAQVTVTWNTAGTQQITLLYTDQNGCNPEQPSAKNVQVNVLPVPLLSGTQDICSGIPVTYSTETGMQQYTWSVSQPDAIVSGGGPGDHEVVVSWINPGPNTVSVNYSLGTGCTAAIPTMLPVVVHQATPPQITADPGNKPCVTFTEQYQTQPGMSGYAWSCSPGGTILSGLNTDMITVQWNQSGPQWVRVNFTNNDGCRADIPTQFDVVVNTLPDAAITAAAGPECQGIAHGYQAGPDPSCGYAWSLAPSNAGGFLSGQGTNLVSIQWNSTGSNLIHLTVTNNLSGCHASSFLAAEVKPSPNPQFEPCFDMVTTTAAKPFLLRGAHPYIPGQGLFSGTHVSLNLTTNRFEFNPYGAQPGTSAVTYQYENVYGCRVDAPSIMVAIQSRPFTCGNNLLDVRDGKLYSTASFGTRCWMTHNLNYGNPLGDHEAATDNCIAEKHCLPGDTGCSSYGGLYSWNELMMYGDAVDNKGLCPPEWHVPTESEWNLLLWSLGTMVTPPDGVAGNPLKDINLPSGFHSLTSGLLYLDNLWRFYGGTLKGAMFWTSTPFGDQQAVARGVNTENPSASKYAGSRGNSFSVRCIRDN